MDLSPRQFADATVLSPGARIDHASSEAFRESLLAELARGAGAGLVVLDMSRVQYVASTGLRAVLVGAKQVKAQGGTLLLAGLQPLVKEVFDITRFTSMFPVFPTVGEALAATSPAAATAFAAQARG
jgi:anti-sigma B factor antagonist